MTKSNVYIARRENKLKQKDVAKMIGRSEQYYRERENGIREFTIKEGKILADIYNCSLDELFGNEVYDKEDKCKDKSIVEITNHLEEIVRLLKGE